MRLATRDPLFLLLQIFVIGPDVSYPEMAELWLAYHDILARHAFGSFVALLKEVCCCVAPPI